MACRTSQYGVVPLHHKPNSKVYNCNYSQMTVLIHKLPYGINHHSHRVQAWDYPITLAKLSTLRSCAPRIIS